MNKKFVYQVGNNKKIVEEVLCQVGHLPELYWECSVHISCNPEMFYI